MASKVKSRAGCRNKGASGEREAAKAIMANCPGVAADRNARNGKATSDVLVWMRDSTEPPRLLEVKRVESLDIGTKAMAKIREQATADGAIGVLWRRNRSTWRLDCQWYGSWVTFSGPDVWRQIESIVTE